MGLVLAVYWPWAGPALGRVLNDAGDADGFCLKKINNISEFSSSKNNHQIII